MVVITHPLWKRIDDVKSTLLKVEAAMKLFHALYVKGLMTTYSFLKQSMISLIYRLCDWSVGGAPPPYLWEAARKSSATPVLGQRGFVLGARPKGSPM